MANDAFSLAEQVNELAVIVHETELAMRGRLYGLAVRIMRELGHPSIADDIQQCLYNEARKEGSK